MLDTAYFPVQLKVIDVVAGEGKTQCVCLYFQPRTGACTWAACSAAGYSSGCWRGVSEYAALRYALLVIALVHFLGWFMMRNIVKDLDKP
ncbi:MAG: hypothetical protein IPK76_08425 [Lewinellaceae bacterium]|nr:hypothetical protein [Lewinellaceae bacterium]